MYFYVPLSLDIRVSEKILHGEKSVDSVWGSIFDSRDGQRIIIDILVVKAKRAH